MIDGKIAAGKVVDEFLKIAQIPRGSGNEKKIGDYLISWAEEKKLFCVRDEAGNVIIEKDAAPGFEAAPTVILQSHMDMVCVSDGRGYDAENDPIKVLREGDVIRAEGTSLGADDGAGMAIIMYILSDKSLSHGRLRAIFTVAEETSMKGSECLDAKYLDGKYLINLDWEEFSSACTSCANNVCMNFDLALATRASGKKEGVKVSLSGFLGGHSGADIHLGRANAVKLTGEFLARLEEEAEISSFQGGSVKNAIAARSVCVLATDCAENVMKEAEIFGKEIAASFPGEKEFSIKCEKCAAPETVFPKEAKRAVGLINSIHSGVYYMSQRKENLVETSANIGVVKMAGGQIHLEVLSRSSSKFHSEEMKRAGGALAEAFGFEFSVPNENPIWYERGETHLESVIKRAFSECSGEKLRIEGIHAGLECAYFAQKAPQLEMISFGPQLYDVHSPKERWDISRLDETVKTVVRALEILGE